MEQSDYLSMPQNQPHLRVMAVLRRWDPIGVITDENQDEYDGYSVQIVHMLDRCATVNDIVEYMRLAVTEHMGMSHFDEPHSRDCAEELVNYWRSRRDR
jgi:hypothetical protein